MPNGVTLPAYWDTPPTSDREHVAVGKFRKWTVDPPGKDQLGDVRLMASAGARLLTESGYRADFSESLIDADAYLDTLGNPEDQNTLIVAFGCYLGETRCRVLGVLTGRSMQTIRGG